MKECVVCGDGQFRLGLARTCSARCKRAAKLAIRLHTSQTSAQRQATLEEFNRLYAEATG